MQIQFGREFAPSEADGGPPLICQGHRWQISSPPRKDFCHSDSYDDNNVAADQSNLCGQRSIDAAAAADDDDDDANNARRYADDTTKAKAEADKEVGGGDAEVSD